MTKQMGNIACLLLCFGLAGCHGNGGPEDNATGETSQGVTFTQEQRIIADQIISVFENNTPEIQYGYAENLNDGRGITAGRAGFTSATGDLLLVVERYTQRVPGNPLARYLPRLRQLARAESGATAGLEGLEDAWQAAAGDQAFRDVQDEVVDEEYYCPAMHHSRQLGLAFPLSLLSLYDSCMQHGDGDDPDGLPALIRHATERSGGAPNTGSDERAWLSGFLDLRRSVLLHPANTETRAAWAESVGRVDALREILEDNNTMLTPPLVINPYGTAFTIPQA